MSIRNAQGQARLRKPQGKESVRTKSFCTGCLARIDIRAPRVASRVNDEYGTGLPQVGPKKFKLSVVKLFAIQCVEVNGTTLEFSGKGRADIATRAEEKNTVHQPGWKVRKN